MGKIIIKIPEDIEETLELNISYDELMKKLGLEEKKKKKEIFKEITQKYARKLNVPEVKEEELYE